MLLKHLLMIPLLLVPGQNLVRLTNLVAKDLLRLVLGLKLWVLAVLQSVIMQPQLTDIMVLLSVLIQKRKTRKPFPLVPLIRQPVYKVSLSQVTMILKTPMGFLPLPQLALQSSVLKPMFPATTPSLSVIQTPLQAHVLMRWVTISMPQLVQTIHWRLVLKQALVERMRLH